MIDPTEPSELYDLPENLPDGVFVMGGVPIQFPKKGIRPMGEWKEEHLKPLAETVFELREIDFNVELMGEDGQMGDIGTIIGQFQPLIETLLDVPETVSGAVIDWLKPDAKTKEHLLENGLIEEYLPPLKWIVGQIFPLGKITGSLGLATGTGKRSKSPKLNGVGPKKKRGKKR